MELTECHAGIYISTNKFQLVEVERHSESIKITNIAEAQFSQPIDFEHGNESDTGKLIQEAFEQVQKSITIKAGLFSFALPAGLFYFHQTPYDNSMVHTDLVEQFRWELSILFPFTNVNSFAIQFIEIDKNPVINTNTALVIALPRRYLQMLKNFCSNNHYQLKFIDASNIAVEKSVSFSGEKVVTGITAIIVISSNEVIIMLSSAGKIVYSKNLKTDYLPDALSFIDEELKSTTSKKINRNVLSKVYLTGDEIDSETISGVTKIVNQSPVIFNPFKLVSASPSVLENHSFTTLNNRFAAAAGAAYRIAG